MISKWVSAFLYIDKLSNKSVDNSLDDKLISYYRTQIIFLFVHYLDKKTFCISSRLIHRRIRNKADLNFCLYVRMMVTLAGVFCSLHGIIRRCTEFDENLLIHPGLT